MKYINYEEKDDYGLVDENGVFYSLDGKWLIGSITDQVELRIIDECIYIFPKDLLTRLTLKNIYFPDNMHLAKIEFPKSLENIFVKESNDSYSSVGGILFDKKETTLLSFPKSNHNKNYIIPNTTKTIAKNAFRGGHISSVIIPESVRLIEEYAFADCPELKSVIIIGSDITISGNAFNGSENIEELIIVADEVYEKNDKYDIKNTISNCKITLLVNNYISNKVVHPNFPEKEVRIDVKGRCSGVELVVPYGEVEKFNNLIYTDYPITIREVSQQEVERIMDLAYQYAEDNEHLIDLAKRFTNYPTIQKEKFDTMAKQNSMVNDLAEAFGISFTTDGDVDNSY